MVKQPALLGIALASVLVATGPVTAGIGLFDLDALPDMIMDGSRLNPYQDDVDYSANSCEVQEGMIEPGPQRLVRFSSYLVNAGTADMVIGSPSQNPDNFEWQACHRHWHVKSYTEARIWSVAAHAAYDALRQQFPDLDAVTIIKMLPPPLGPSATEKQGWCVIDLTRYSQYGGSNQRRFTSCSYMGISQGWADVYGSGISAQWVVVTALPPGEYILEVEVNPGRHYAESDFVNNVATQNIFIT